jgi:hypothetical protein
MRYFTAAWASGDVDDVADSGAVSQYNRDLTEAFSVDDPVRQFAERVGLNDAFVDRIEWDSTSGRLNLLLLTGSLQVGYWHTELTYRDVSEVEGEDVLRAALMSRPTEIWYDEFYRDGGAIVHGVLLAPRGRSFRSTGEFSIRFRAFSYAQSPAADRQLKFPSDQSRWKRR